MRDGKVPTLRYLSDKSDTDFMKQYDLEKEDYITLSHNVFNYYNEKDVGPDPIKYKISKDNDETIIKTGLGIFNDTFPEINKINKNSRNFSEFDLDIVDGLDVYEDETWNGSQVDLWYNDGVLQIGESDYYTTIGYLKMLEIELLKQYENKDSDLYIRDNFLQTEKDFKKPKRPVGATTGGVIVANTGSEWNIIVGTRSFNASVNSGLYSIFPNGGIKYDKVDDENFEPTLNEQFVDELFDDRPKGSIYHNKNIKNILTTKGWNLKHGDFVTGYTLLIDSSVSYDVLMSSAEYNNEIDDIIEIPISDYSMISEVLSLNKMTASVIPTVVEALRMLDNNGQYPDLPYNIERI